MRGVATQLAAETTDRWQRPLRVEGIEGRKGMRKVEGSKNPKGGRLGRVGSET